MPPPPVQLTDALKRLTTQPRTAGGVLPTRSSSGHFGRNGDILSGSSKHADPLTRGHGGLHKDGRGHTSRDLRYQPKIESDTKLLPSEAASSGGHTNVRFAAKPTAATRGQKLFYSSISRAEAAIPTSADISGGLNDAGNARSGTKRGRSGDTTVPSTAKTPRLEPAIDEKAGTLTDNAYCTKHTLAVLGIPAYSVVAEERELPLHVSVDTVCAHVRDGQIMHCADGLVFLIHSAACSLAASVPNASMSSSLALQCSVLKENAAAMAPDCAESRVLQPGMFVVSESGKRLYVVEQEYFDVRVPKSEIVYRCLRLADAELGRLSAAIAGPQLAASQPHMNYWLTAEFDVKSLPLQPGFPEEWEKAAEAELHVTHADPYAAFRDVIYKFPNAESIAVPTNKSLKWDTPKPAFIALPRFEQLSSKAEKRSAAKAGVIAPAPLQEVLRSIRAGDVSVPATVKEEREEIKTAANIAIKPNNNNNTSREASATVANARAGDEAPLVKTQAGECEICEKHFDNIIAHVYNHASHVAKSKSVVISVPDVCVEEAKRAAETVTLKDLLAAEEPPSTRGIDVKPSSLPVEAKRAAETVTLKDLLARQSAEEPPSTRGIDVKPSSLPAPVHYNHQQSIPYYSAHSLRRVAMYGAAPVGAMLSPQEITTLANARGVDAAWLASQRIRTGSLLDNIMTAVDMSPAPGTFCFTCAPLVERHPSIAALSNSNSTESQSPSVLRFNTETLTYEWNEEFTKGSSGMDDILSALDSLAKQEEALYEARIKAALREQHGIIAVDARAGALDYLRDAGTENESRKAVSVAFEDEPALLVAHSSSSDAKNIVAAAMGSAHFRGGFEGEGEDVDEEEQGGLGNGSADF